MMHKPPKPTQIGPLPTMAKQQSNHGIAASPAHQQVGDRQRHRDARGGFALALVLLAVFLIGLMTYLIVGESDPKAAQSAEMQKTVSDVVNGVKAIQYRIDMVKFENCWPNGNNCKDGTDNSAAIPANTLVKKSSYPYAGAAASGASVVTCDANLPDASTCSNPGQKCGWAWQANLCYRTNNGVVKRLWDFNGESMPTVNNGDLFISANGQTTTFPSGVSAPAALTTGQAQQMASLAGGGTKNQDIFQYRNKMPASGTEYGGVHLRILPSDPNDVYTRRVLDAAAASLQSHGYRTQRCAAGTGGNPGALMIGIYDENPTANMCL
ncbi:MAG: hypothetical protein ACK5WY_05225 [Holosporaceae bacterium]|jgi:hypothetical protein